MFQLINRYLALKFWEKKISWNISEFWRRDYISFVNPSLFCLHKSLVRFHAYTARQKWEWNRAEAKIYCISSHLLFWDRESPEGNPNLPRSSKPSRPIPIPPLSNSILNPLISKFFISSIKLNSLNSQFKVQITLIQQQNWSFQLQFLIR